MKATRAWTQVPTHDDNSGRAQANTVPCNKDQRYVGKIAKPKGREMDLKYDDFCKVPLIKSCRFATHYISLLIPQLPSLKLSTFVLNMSGALYI